MILPRGVTGFVDEPLPSVDFRAFKAVCHEVARRLGGTVVKAESCKGEVTPNFHTALMNLPARSVEVICNQWFPLVACIAPFDGNWELSYLDVPGMANFIEETGTFKMQSRAEMEARVEPAVVSNLAENEITQMRYWRPRRVGDVVFNFWD
jgi:hypothetical protein